MNQNQNELSITVDNVQHPISSLPQPVQQMFYIYQEWNGDLDKVRKEQFKLESAIRAVSAEIEARIRQHVQDQRAALEELNRPKAEAPAAE